MNEVTMSKTIKSITIIPLLLLFFIINAQAQYVHELVKTSLCIHGGYFLAVGEWKAHRYAKNVDQFQSSYTINAEFEIKRQKFGFAFWLNHVCLGVLMSNTNKSK